MTVSGGRSIILDFNVSNGLSLLLCWILGEGAGGLKCLGLEGVGAKKGVAGGDGGRGREGKGEGGS